MQNRRAQFNKISFHGVGHHSSCVERFGGTLLVSLSRNDLSSRVMRLYVVSSHELLSFVEEELSMFTHLCRSVFNRCRRTRDCTCLQVTLHGGVIEKSRARQMSISKL